MDINDSEINKTNIIQDKQINIMISFFFACIINYVIFKVINNFIQIGDSNLVITLFCILLLNTPIIFYLYKKKKKYLVIGYSIYLIGLLIVIMFLQSFFNSFN